MPRPPRIDVPGLPQHIVFRGHDRKPCFFREKDYRILLRLLGEGSKSSETDIHAFVLMTNHVHLLVTGRKSGSISKLMHSAERRYSRYVNREQGRSGTLFEGRFRSNLIESEVYLLRCMRYIELNPVRAGMVARPENYPWSSHVENAGGNPTPWIMPHDQYLALGRNAQERGAAYRALFERPLEDQELEEIRRHAAHERVLGSESFRSGLAAKLGRSVEIVARGRPRKSFDETKKSNPVLF